MKLVTDVAMKLGGAFGVLYRLPANDRHYAGKEVKLGTPSRPIFWYQLTKEGNYKVLYADLSVKDLSAKESPTLPSLEGKQ